MLPALRSAATGLLAQQVVLDVTAHNLANVNTPGFKRSLPRFTDLLYPEGRRGNEPLDRIGRGVRVEEVRRDLSQGIMEATENPHHLCVEGEGFFAVRLEDGSLGYTRAGILGVDSSGRLTLNGRFFLEPSLLLPPGGRELVVDQRGTVRVRTASGEERELGRIPLARFPNPEGLEARGDGIFLATDAAGLPVSALPGEEGTGFLRQGYLERSNVDVADEMVRMISALRAYQLNAKMVQASDEALDVANRIVRG